MTDHKSDHGRPHHQPGASATCALAISATLATAMTGETARAAATLDHAPYGTTQAGQPVEIFTMTNDHGLVVRFLSYGGVITEIHVPDRTGRPRQHRARPAEPARIRDPQRALRRDHRPLRQSHRRRAVHAEWPDLPSDRQQRRQLAARRPQRARQAGLGRRTHAGAERGRRDAQLCQQGRRAELSRHADDARDLHADQRQRAADRLPGHHRQGHGDQLHQPFLLQPGRQRLGFGRGSDAAGERGPLHAEPDPI